MRPDFPMPDPDWEPTREFWAGAARRELRIPRCNHCGRLRWYPTEMCRFCQGEELTWETMSGRATLFSWVVVTHAFLPQFREKVPFIPALVSLDEDPAVRLSTELVDVSPDQLAFGQPVEVTFRGLQFAGVEGSLLAPFFAPSSSC